MKHDPDSNPRNRKAAIVVGQIVVGQIVVGQTVVW
jgi:hypothetical protein